MHMPSVGFVSLGCAKNLVDSEHMASVLRAEGIPLARSPEEADIVLVNTCGFIGDAKEESIDAILAACARKKTGDCKAVAVAGCLTQRYAAELRRSVPEVDAWLGLDDIPKIGRIVRRLARGERDLFSVSARSRRIFSPLPSRVLLTGGPFAYLKIAEGCNHQCAFCAIPAIRGRYRSRGIPDVLREAEDLLSRGARELNLISQDTTRYGLDLGGGTSLPKLLRELGRLGGRFWIRLLYGHPSHVTNDLLDIMAGVPQVCRYLDIPVQHSHPDMLCAMSRAGSVDAVRTLAGRARRAMPDVVLRTTCLVGFPGETDAHFEDLVRFARDTEFDHLGVFAYSREEQTPAAALPGQVPAAVARRRRARLMRIQQGVVRRKLGARVGETGTVLVIEKPGKANAPWIARSCGQAPEVDGVTLVRADGKNLRAGDFLTVRYTGVAGYDLVAAPLKPGPCPSGYDKLIVPELR